MVEICKICNKEYRTINLAHVRTHGIDSIADYNNYSVSEVKSDVEENKVQSIWDYVDTNSRAYKVRVAKLGKRTKIMSEERNVTIQENNNCPVCHDGIYEPHGFVYLRTSWERKTKVLQTPQNIMHKPCAIAAVEDLQFELGMVRNPNFRR